MLCDKTRPQTRHHKYKSVVYIELLRFLDTEVVTSCRDLTQCGCSGQPWLLQEEVWNIDCHIFISNISLPPTQVSVRLTELRMSEQYVVFYHTWAWGLITGYHHDHYYHYFYHYHHYHVIIMLLCYHVIIMFPRLAPRGVPELAEHQHLPGSQDSPLLSQH